jgi:DNA repair exonuclease SbcCD ATPase subunit
MPAAKIQALHPNAAAPRARSGARSKLAAAISRHRATQEMLLRLGGALPRAYDEWSACASAVDTATEKLAEARRAEHADLARRFMAGADLDVDAVKIAVVELEQAQAGLDRARRVRTALEEEQAQAERDLTTRRYELRSALAEVVSSSEAIRRLVAEHDAARARVDAAATALRFLGPLLVPEDLKHWDAINRPFPPTQQLLPDWSAALAALEQDPDATLPGDEPGVGRCAAAASTTSS